MSSDEEELELDESTPQLLDNVTEDDAGDGIEIEDGVSTRASPVPNSPSLSTPTASQETREPAAISDGKPQQPQHQQHNFEQPKRQVDLRLNPATLTCQTYDCVPLVAAVHPFPIYSLAATRCFRWVFTGSEDGYIRKWDFFASMNGKSSLTQALRQQYVDSVTMAGVLRSWWENEEKTQQQPPQTTTPVKQELSGIESIVTQSEPVKLSPVYSMDVHSEALWALQGTESGGINLVTVRHDEGKCHHVLRKHSAPVSVLRIAPGETAAISGSWDKSVLEWDLNTGSVVRTFAGHSSQISSVAFRPAFKPPPVDNKDIDPSGNNVYWDQKDPNILLTTSFDGQCLIWDRREPDKDVRRLGQNDRSPPWCLSACWSTDGTKIYMGRRNGQVDEWDYGSQKLIQSFRMPPNSGPVSYVASMPNGKHIICASNDNVRLWNTSIETAYTIYPDSDPRLGKPSKSSPSASVIPFTILPGHHGGVISHILIDPTCRYMITTSGNRGWDGQSTNACLFYDVKPINAL